MSTALQTHDIELYLVTINLEGTSISIIFYFLTYGLESVA